MNFPEVSTTFHSHTFLTLNKIWSIGLLRLFRGTARAIGILFFGLHLPPNFRKKLPTPKNVPTPKIHSKTTYPQNVNPIFGKKNTPNTGTLLNPNIKKNMLLNPNIPNTGTLLNPNFRKKKLCWIPIFRILALCWIPIFRTLELCWIPIFRILELCWIPIFRIPILELCWIIPNPILFKPNVIQTQYYSYTEW